MSPSAWLRARRYRGPEQPEGISTSFTRRMDGYTFLLRTLCPIRRRDKDAGWSGPGIRLPDAQASRRGQPSARRKRRRDENSCNNHLAGVRLSSSAARARRCSLARMRAPRARPRLASQRSLDLQAAGDPRLGGTRFHHCPETARQFDSDDLGKKGIRSGRAPARTAHPGNADTSPLGTRHRAHLAAYCVWKRTLMTL